MLTDREGGAARWAEAIAWDAGLADDELWKELHSHFTEPELVELGYFIGLTMGQQRFLKTLYLRHGELSRDSLASPPMSPQHSARRPAAEDPSPATSANISLNDSRHLGAG